MTAVSVMDILAYERGHVSFNVAEESFVFMDMSFSYAVCMGTIALDIKSEEGSYALNIVPQKADHDEEELLERENALRGLHKSLESCLGPSKKVLAEYLASAHGGKYIDFFGTGFQNEKRDSVEALFDSSKGFEIIASHIYLWVENFSDEEKNLSYKELITQVAETFRGLAAVTHHLHVLAYREYQEEYGKDKTLDDYCRSPNPAEL